MRRKKLVVAVLNLSIVLILLCGTALGLMFRKTDTLVNQFNTAKVDCVVHEKLGSDVIYTDKTQTADSKTSIQVKNTGNIDAYIRVRFVSYWVDTNGQIVAKLSQMPTINISDEWFNGADNTFYCKKPLKPNELTAELLSAPINLEKSTDGYYQVVEVFADAIQSKPEKAVREKWKVEIQNGEIVS